ncbi:MAG: sodium:solute symporter [Bacteroidetes bacterium]|nr:MAG: sodium:solute symporter [Bacteroidota bacterium]
MQIAFIDGLIILAYLALTIVIGFWLSKRASRNQQSYFLGGNALPWYMLGLSNASGMFDISGTMWLVTGMFVYGMKSVWIPWLWPVFNQVFLMVFLSQWLRRSQKTTGAEWIMFRFGRGTGAKLSHGVVVIFALVSCLGFLAYGFIGLGKFVEIFIPWEVVSGYVPFTLSPEFVPHFYGIVFTLFAVFYAILGGMTSIVWADVLQFSIMTAAAIIIAIIAMTKLAAMELAVPMGWMDIFFGSRLDLDWTRIIPEVNAKIESDGYELFSAFFMMMVFKGIFVSLAGPAPNYDMQKILSTKSPAEAAKMSGFVSIVLMPARYLMIAGFTVLGLLFYDQLDLIGGGTIDFEQILPSAINQFVPVGLMGLLLAGLLAAFMSTFAGTLNAAQAYVSNDLFLRYVKPDASPRQIMITNYTVGIVVVLVSIYLGIMAKDVNQVLQLIVSALWGSYVASNVLKWYWWRFNSMGYFVGMVFGFIGSGLPLMYPKLLEALFPGFAADIRILYFFPIIMLFALMGCLLGTYLGRPTEEETLIDFYQKTRPWGFWGPIRDKVLAQNPTFQPNRNFWRDMGNIVVGTIAQTALVAAPMYLVLMQAVPLLLSLVVTLICGLILYRTWWQRLED